MPRRPQKPPIYALLFFLTSCQFCLAQDPIVFSQFFLNPLQFNPSYAASNGHMEANLLYRQQWIGIENAPSAAAFNFQAPVGRNVSLAGSIATSKTVLLNNTSALATFAYRVRLGFFQHVNFGLSLGMAMNNFDLDAVGMANDPALANVLARNMYSINQFGVNYQIRKLNVGFALPKLLDSKPNSGESFQPAKFNPFNHKFGSVSYTFNVTNDVQIAPMVIYRALDQRQDQWEGLITATYRHVFWIGASYRDGYGITGFVGFKARELLRVGYAYERPTGRMSAATLGSHEISAGLRLGKRDREDEVYAQRKRKDSLAQVARNQKMLEKPKPIGAKEEPVVVKEEPVRREPRLVQNREPEKPVERPVVQTDTSKVQPTPAQTETKPPVAQKRPDEFSFFTGHYVIVGAFRSYSNAMSLIRDLRSKNQFPDLMYILDKNFYYVFLFHSDDRKDAIKELGKVRNRYPRAWLYSPQIAEAPKGS